jgi:hypothetical protein
MGMFDTIVQCDYPLPNRPEWATDFQTKDLDCEMNSFRITIAGVLEERIRDRWIPYPVHPNSDGTPVSINIYTYDHSVVDSEWYECQLTFDEDHVVSCVQVERPW